jgi:hypothetical protein
VASPVTFPPAVFFRKSSTSDGSIQSVGREIGYQERLMVTTSYIPPENGNYMDQLEFALSQIGGTAFETFAMDFLRSQGYEVHESGERGRDGGWDAHVEIANQVGIAHASVRNDWRAKLRDDADKVADLEENKTGSYDIYVFVTNQHVSGEQELRLQSEIADEYGWTLKIHHKNNLMGELRQSTPELGERHFDVSIDDEREHFEEIKSLHEDRMSEIQNRQGDAKDLVDGPVVALHIIPTSIFSKSNAVGSDFPSPVILGDGLGVDHRKRGKKSYTYENRGTGYATLRNDGLYETTTDSLITGRSADDLWLNPSIRRNSRGLDASVVIATRNVLDDLSDLNYSGTAVVSLSLLGAENVKMNRPEDKNRPFFDPPKFAEVQYSTEYITIDISEQEVIEDVEPMLSEIWRQFGYEDGTTNIENGKWTRGRVWINQETLLEEGQR